MRTVVLAAAAAALVAVLAAPVAQAGERTTKGPAAATSGCRTSGRSPAGRTSPGGPSSAPPRAGRGHGRAAAVLHRGRAPRGLRRAAQPPGRRRRRGSRSASPVRPNGRTGWVPQSALGRAATSCGRGSSSTARTLRAVLTRRGKRDLARAGRRGRAGHADARRALPHPREAARLRRLVRARGLRHERLLGPERLARRRRDRHPRHEPARADARPPVARLHPRAQRATSAASPGSCRSARRC